MISIKIKNKHISIDYKESKEDELDKVIEAFFLLGFTFIKSVINNEHQRDTQDSGTEKRPVDSDQK